MVERLHFRPELRYSATEAAVHISRYALARSLCPGKLVLDVACGEGYGSWLLRSWGAAFVTGVDISDEAIAVARRRFATDEMDFRVGDATQLSRLLGRRRFDLVICTETIEHIRQPKKLLRSIKTVSRPTATIIMTCPNDYWYYEEGDGNPFHMRKYNLEEFKSLTESVLGSARSFRIGSLTGGFATIPLTSTLVAGPEEDQSAMIRAEPIVSGLMVPAETSWLPTPHDCSYFVGVWGQDIDDIVATTFPLSMNAGDRSILGGPGISELTGYIRRLEARRDELELHNEDLAKQEETRAVIWQQDQLQLKDANAALINAEARAEQLASNFESKTRELRASEAKIGELETALIDAEGRIGKLESAIADLSRDLRTAALGRQATNAENQALRERAGQLGAQLLAAKTQLELLDTESEGLRARNLALSENLQEVTTALNKVPWRAVGVYRKIRRLVPRSMLKLGSTIIDFWRRHS